jgi:hypothetical protein
MSNNLPWYAQAMQKGFRAFDGLNLDTSIITAFKKNNQLNVEPISHVDYDGNNGFWRLLFNTGFKNVVPPDIRTRTTLTFFEKMAQYFRVLKQFSEKSRCFRSDSKLIIDSWGLQSNQETQVGILSSPQKSALQTIGLADYLGHALFFASISINEVKRMREHAANHNVTLNTWMFWCLNKIMQPLLVGNDCSSWVMPVSAYQNLNQLEHQGVLTSVIEINIGSNTTPLQLHEMVKHEVNSGLHWGTLFGACINWFLPLFLYKLILKATIAKKIRVGTFSNIGKWKGENSEFGNDHYLCPPVHQGQPLGVCVNELNGQLNFGWKADLSLNLQSNHLAVIHEKFKLECLGA